MLKLVVKILNSFLEILLTIVMTILVLDIIWQVISRWIINNPELRISDHLRSFFVGMKINPTFPWTEELATFLMVWIGMLGSSVALKRGSHLGIDYIVSKFSLRSRLITEIFIFLCIGLFSLFGMFVGGCIWSAELWNLDRLLQQWGFRLDMYTWRSQSAVSFWYCTVSS